MSGRAQGSIPSYIQAAPSPSPGRATCPTTPSTPSDAGQVSDEDERLILRFHCRVIMMGSGRLLGLFKCDEHTSLGYIRNCVKQRLEDVKKEGELQQKVDSFQLLQNESICGHDYLKVHEVFEDMPAPVDYVLTVVLM